MQSTMRTIEPYVHPEACVHPGAILKQGCWIGPNVTIDDNVVVGAYSVIGDQPEHRDYYSSQRLGKGVLIMSGVRIFEFVTIHSGTQGRTYIGRNSAIFQRAHIAHDVWIEKDVTIGGQTSLAGHTVVMEGGIVGGKSCTHQHSIIGPLGFLAPMAFLKGCIPPAEIWIGCPARPTERNKIGLERAGYSYEKFLEMWLEEFEQLKKHSPLGA